MALVRTCSGVLVHWNGWQRSFQASMKIRIAWTRSATLVEAFQRRCQASSNDQASSAGRATTRLLSPMVFSVGWWGPGRAACPLAWARWWSIWDR